VLSLDLVTGYSGVATLGHATLFGAGAYAAGIVAAKFGITDPLLMLAVGALAGAAAGAIASLVILRGHGLSQLVLSIAVVSLAHEAANKLSGWTGGSDGLSGISPSALFGMFRFDLFGRTAFIMAVVLLLVVFVVLRIIVRSPFGMLCRGIKQDPVRIRAMGAPVYFTLVKMYAIAGAVAGLGGALSAIATKVVGLDSLSFTLSAEALVMLVLGGTGKLFGALVGTLVFVWFEDRVSAINPFHWLTIVGVLLVAVVLFAPTGLTGAAEAIWKRMRGARS
jgi:branched-chain amino acid transport system permease protein